MLRTRIIFGSLLAAGLLGLFLLDGYLARQYGLGWAPVFFVVIGLIIVGGVHEMVSLMRSRGWRMYESLLMLASLAMPAAAAYTHATGRTLFRQVGPLVITPVLAVVAGLTLVVVLAETIRAWRRGPDTESLASLGGNLLVLAYIGILSLFLIAIRFIERPDGLRCLLVALAVIKSSDIGAYVTGKAIGRRPLVPRLSPNKTVEGCVGGLLLAVAVSLALGLPLLALAWYKLVVFALVVSVFAMLGDLAESLIKRSAGVKDSGQGMPGFGGVLDVIDSILLGAPVAYLLLVLFAGGQ
ncbi:MAG: hypothetical protein GWP05_03990 [Anaerolineaceae bacterium]|nr:hypothetical protein [Anaerolineaceae bacterium]